jgi:20S proteasome alpha/beta subunit
MTLIVALRCRDGVVIASDSQATVSQFISQPAKLETQKLFPLGRHAVWGSAGDVGLQQKIADALNAHPTPGIWENDIKEIRQNFKDVVIPVMKKALIEYVPATQQASPATAHLLVAGHTRDRSWILEVDPNGTDTLNDEFGFCAVGSGNIFAHHALADIRHHCVHEQSAFYGQVLAHRVVNGAIECAASGLGGPVQMWTVTAKGAHQLDSAKRKEVEDSVSLWKELEAETLSGLLRPQKPTEE